MTGATGTTGALIVTILYWLVLAMAVIFGSTRWRGDNSRANLATDLPILAILVLIGIRSFAFWPH